MATKNWQTYTGMTSSDSLQEAADDLLLRDKSDTTDHATEGTVKRVPWEFLAAWFFKFATRYLAAIFSVTASTTFVDVTNLTVNLIAGKKYVFEAYLPVTIDAVGNGKFQMTGTATMTLIDYLFTSQLYSSSGFSPYTIHGVALTTSHTIRPSSVSTDFSCAFRGGLTCNAGGTFKVQFAQVTASGTSSVLAGAWLRVHEAQ